MCSSDLQGGVKTPQGGRFPGRGWGQAGADHEKQQSLEFWDHLYWNLDAELRSQSQGASLVAQCLRICLLMQGTRVRSLVWEDPTCRRATRPVSQNY